MHDPENLERADDAIAGGCEIAKNNVAALFAAEIEISCNHFLDHVAIAHFCADDFAAIRGKCLIQAEIAHHRRDQRVVAQLT